MFPFDRRYLQRMGPLRKPPNEELFMEMGIVVEGDT